MSELQASVRSLSLNCYCTSCSNYSDFYRVFSRHPPPIPTGFLCSKEKLDDKCRWTTWIYKTLKQALTQIPRNRILSPVASLTIHFYIIIYSKILWCKFDVWKCIGVLKILKIETDLTSYVKKLYRHLYQDPLCKRSRNSFKRPCLLWKTWIDFVFIKLDTSAGTDLHLSHYWYLWKYFNEGKYVSINTINVKSLLLFISTI